jgi:hypothetical protein
MLLAMAGKEGKGFERAGNCLLNSLPRLAKGMESKHEETRTVNGTGLSEEAIRAVEASVAILREQASGSSAYRSP